MGFGESEQGAKGFAFLCATPYSALMADGVGMYHIVVERFIALGDVLGDKVTLPHETAIFPAAGCGKGYTVSYQPISSEKHTREVAYIMSKKKASF